MSKHTPGPWVIGERQCIHAPKGKDAERGEPFDVCEVYGDFDHESGEDLANARLIAAAPRMKDFIAGILRESDRLNEDEFAEAVAIMESINAGA